MKQNARLLCGGLLAALLMPLATVAAQEPIAVQGAVMGVHDPSIAREGNHYYIFTTGRAKDGGQIPIRCSEDWNRCCVSVMTDCRLGTTTPWKSAAACWDWRCREGLGWAAA